MCASPHREEVSLSRPQWSHFQSICKLPLSALKVVVGDHTVVWLGAAAEERIFDVKVLFAARLVVAGDYGEMSNSILVPLNVNTYRQFIVYLRLNPCERHGPSAFRIRVCAGVCCEMTHMTQGLFQAARLIAFFKNAARLGTARACDIRQECPRKPALPHV